MKIKIRPYTPADCPQLADLFYETVHTVNKKDYTKEQLDAWADGNVDLEAWNQSFLEHDTVVAEADGQIAAFGDMDASGYLDRLFVRKTCQGQGIATAICNRLEAAASAETLTVHASITAKKFFEDRGYKLKEVQQAYRHDVPLLTYFMEKPKTEIKRGRAQAIVAASVTAGAVVGAVPLPIADAFLLTPIEMAEIHALASVYGIRNNEKSRLFFNAIVEVGTVSAAAKAVISGLKAVPGINLAAGVLNAVIAGSFVAAIGEGTIYAFEQVHLGKKTIADIDWVKQVVESKLSAEFMEKVMQAAKQAAGEKDKKALGRLILEVFTGKKQGEHRK